MKNPFLIGPTIYLRPLEREDAPTITPWLNHPDITRYLRRYRPINVRQEEEWIDKLNQTEHDLGVGIVIQQTDALIGCTGLMQIDFSNRHAGFGIVIGVEEEWGKGYGTEATRLMVQYAFETHNLNRVWLHVYDYNQRAIRAYEKVGFRKEGVLRQEMFRDGHYWDTVVMGILRDEWPRSSPSPVV